MSVEDDKQWIGAADWLKSLRLDIVTGNRPQYVLTAVIDHQGNFIISMVGTEDPAAVRSLLAACMDLVGAAEISAHQQSDPNRILN